VSEESKRVDRFGIGERASWGAALGNLGLVIFKLVAGLLGHSAAMVADAMHSTSDILASLGVIASLVYLSFPAIVNTARTEVVGYAIAVGITGQATGT
jgi:Co/Zn/Cd efflux system component